MITAGNIMAISIYTNTPDTWFVFNLICVTLVKYFIINDYGTNIPHDDIIGSQAWHILPCMQQADFLHFLYLVMREWGITGEWRTQKQEEWERWEIAEVKRSDRAKERNREEEKVRKEEIIKGWKLLMLSANVRFFLVKCVKNVVCIAFKSV